MRKILNWALETTLKDDPNQVVCLFRPKWSLTL